MSRARLLAPVLLFAGLVLHARAAGAQATIGADLSLYSSYVWRGVSLTNKPVAQPNVYLTIPTGNASLTVGGWANIDIGRYDDPNDDLSQSGGVSGFDLAEFDPWAEVSLPVGKATLAAGVIGYVFPNDFGATEAFNTWEVYGKVGLSVPLSPKLAVFYDVDKVNGAYLEATVAHSIPLGPTLSLNLGGLAGWSAGQAESDEDINNYFENGFTHLDISAGVPFTAGIFSITPSAHFVINGDEVTKFTAPGDANDVKVWGGVTISWSRSLAASSTEP